MPLPPLFLIAPSRSGSTLLSQMLDAHPRLAFLPETFVFDSLARLCCTERFVLSSQTTILFNELWNYVWRFDPLAAEIVADVACSRSHYTGPVRPIVEEIAERYRVARHAEGWGEKTPIHTLHVRYIRTLFPEARFVRLVRDPRDIVVSYADAWNAGAFDADFVAKTAAEVRAYLVDLLDEGIWVDKKSILVRYEDLVSKPVEELQRICEMLDIEFSPEMLSYTDSARAQTLARTALHRKLGGKVLAGNFGKYRTRLSFEQIGALDRCFAEPMRQLGYEPDSDLSRSSSSDELGTRIDREYRSFVSTRRALARRARGGSKVLVHSLTANHLLALRGHDIARGAKAWRERVARLHGSMI